MKHPSPGFFPKIALFLAIVLASCGKGDSSTAILWTDRPEFAFYSEYFNSAQGQFQIEVRYFESPARQLIESGETPDIVAASWLNSTSTRLLFKPLDSIFQDENLDRSLFYTSLLSLGAIEGRQYLLPVNFNIPAVVFTRDFARSFSNSFTIEMDEIKEQAGEYNAQANGIYTKMGFSLSSNEEFLFIAAILCGAAFREGAPIAWDNEALEGAVAWIQEWITVANTSIQMEDDFAYKYYNDPPEKLVNSGRVLFITLDSSRFFTLPEEQRTLLDFRWIAANERIPLDEGSVYYGIHSKTKAAAAAEAFTIWFFTPETQRLLLEAGKSKRLNETSFGIAGGFSAMRTVTERIFPRFYPDLMGHIPLEDFLLPANILPGDWISIKQRIILPYLRERIRHTSPGEIRSLERRIADWYRLNRE